MFEKVNPYHPDKVADRIAGAIVDIAYHKADDPKIAVEVLIGHGQCNIIVETSEDITTAECHEAAVRIGGMMPVFSRIVRQDEHLARNQHDAIRCGDNGIFRGKPITNEQQQLKELAVAMAERFKSDGKYVMTADKLIICQSNANAIELAKMAQARFEDKKLVINPLGAWTGGTDVDTGATNRKLGSDMGDAVTGGGMHGKDLSKADVTLNILCHKRAQQMGKEVQAYCAIGDKWVDFRTSDGKVFETLLYDRCADAARRYLDENYGGSFERFAEWGLI
jgi:S-adenosylmethionine synthetase